MKEYLSIAWSALMFVTGYKIMITIMQMSVMALNFTSERSVFVDHAVLVRSLILLQVLVIGGWALTLVYVTHKLVKQLFLETKS